MRWPFKRNQNVENVPQEIQDYYQTERRERTGVAWLLALGTLLITVGLAVALFFGGRWAYRAVVGNDDQKTADTAQVSQNPSEESTEGDTTAPDSNATNEGQTEGANTTPGQTSSTSTSQPNAPAQTNGSTQGASTNNLPNTGPSDTLAIVAATVVFAASAHYALSKESY